MTRNSEKPTLTINQFPGLNTTDDAFEVSYMGLTKALNVDITRQNKVKRRKGATQLLAQANISAAWATEGFMLITEGTNLHSVDSAFTLTLLRSDMTPTTKLAAYEHSGAIYYSNGVQTGIFVNGEDIPMGIDEPPKPVLEEVGIGGMRAGRYQVLLTYVRDNGFESGSGVPAVIELAENNSGITVNYQASTNPTVTGINIYTTRANGTEFYLAMRVDNATSGATYDAHANFLKRALRTQFKSKPPAFDVISYYNGRMMYGNGHILTLSDPYAPEHITSGEAYLPFSSRVTVVTTHEEGFFVGTDSETYYVSGNTLETMSSKRVAPYGAVFGTLTYIDAALLGDGDVSAILPAWMSTKGMCVGMLDGSIQNLTQSTVVIPQGLKGTAMFRQEDGQNHVVSVIQK